MESQPRPFNRDGRLSGSLKEDILRLTLEEPVDSDVNLVIASWYYLKAQGNKARHLLRGRIQRCIELLSDDDPSNNIYAYVMLFTTFLVTRENGANVAGQLYLMKAWQHQPNPGASGDQNAKAGLGQGRDEEPNTESLPDNKAADTKDESSGVDDTACGLANIAIDLPDPRLPKPRHQPRVRRLPNSPPHMVGLVLLSFLPYGPALHRLLQLTPGWGVETTDLRS